MRTRVLVAAATFVVAGAITSCDRTVPGTVAMTTEPGASIRTSTPRSSTPRTTSPRTSTPRTRSPRTSTPRTSPSTPLPTDVAGLTCKEYLTLDPDAQTAVIEEILTNGSLLGPGDAKLAKSLADAVCTFLPNSVVSEILTGGGPP